MGPVCRATPPPLLSCALQSASIHWLGLEWGGEMESAHPEGLASVKLMAACSIHLPTTTELLVQHVGRDKQSNQCRAASVFANLCKSKQSCHSLAIRLTCGVKRVMKATASASLRSSTATAQVAKPCA